MRSRGRTPRGRSPAAATVAPRPPCSTGQPRHVQPAAARCLCQASRSANASCSRPGPPVPRSAANSPVSVGLEPVADLGAELRVGRALGWLVLTPVRYPTKHLLGSSGEDAMSTIPAGPRARRARVRRRGGGRRRRRPAELGRTARPGAHGRPRSTSARGVAAGRPRRGLGAEHVALGRSPRWASHYAGATLVPINTRYTGHEALDILQRTRRRGARRRRAVPRHRPAGRAARGRRPDGLPDAAHRRADPARRLARRRPGAIGWDEIADAGRSRAGGRRPTRGPPPSGPTTSATSCSRPARPGGRKGVLVGAPAGRRRRAGLGRVRRGRRRPTATS